MKENPKISFTKIENKLLKVLNKIQNNYFLKFKRLICCLFNKLKNFFFNIYSKAFIQKYHQYLKSFLKTLITLIDCMIDCLLEAVRKNPGYGMAALIYNNLLNLISGTVKGRLDCDSRKVFYVTLEATQTRRTDLWVFTLLQSVSRLFCVFLFLNDGHLTAGSPLDRCVKQLAKGFQYCYIACVLLMVYGDYLFLYIYILLIELHIDLQLPNWIIRLDKFLETIHLYSMVNY